MAARYWVGGGSSANWNATGNTNWSATSGGAGNASVPTSADDVTFDGAGGSGNTNSTISATITVLSLTITAGYTATMTHNAVLTISGSFTMGANYVIAGSSAISMTGVGTITSNGRTWPNAMTWSGGATGTKTLNGNLTINGLLTIPSGNSQNINRTTTETLTLAGGLAADNIQTFWQPAVYFTGGSISCGNSVNSAYLSGTFYFQGNCSIINRANINFCIQSTLNYVSGTITTTGMQLYIHSTSNLNTSGITWPSLFFFASGNYTTTLSSQLNISGTTTFGTGGVFTINGSNLVTNSLTVTGRSNGGAKIVITNGTWSGSNTTGPDNSIDIQGNATISGTVYKNGGTITYISGTVTTTSSNLVLVISTIMNTSGINWNTVTTSAGITVTLNSLLSATTLTLSAGNATFSGTSGFTVGVLIHAGVSAFTITLKESITYTVTSSLQAFQARTGSIILFTSAHASTKANLTLQNGATCQCLASFTRIDASGGRPIRTFNGTVTNCNNIVTFFDLKTVGSAL